MEKSFSSPPNRPSGIKLLQGEKMFIANLFSNPLFFVMIIVIVTFSVTFHELCHAWMGVREGDYTLRDHITMNPLKQMGIISLVMLAFVGIAWGSVPAHPELFRSRHSQWKVALAGPVGNLILFAVFILLFLLFGKFISHANLKLFLNFFYLGAVYNIVLFLFNLIPAPGFDGFHILEFFFPKLGTLNSEWTKGAFIVVIFLAFFGISYLFHFAEIITGLFLRGLGNVIGIG